MSFELSLFRRPIVVCFLPSKQSIHQSQQFHSFISKTSKSMQLYISIIYDRYLLMQIPLSCDNCARAGRPTVFTKPLSFALVFAPFAPVFAPICVQIQAFVSILFVRTILYKYCAILFGRSWQKVVS